MNVEIRSDIACPWCYIGKRRFEAALAAFDHADEVGVTWRSFELDPDHAAQDAFKERLLRAYLARGWSERFPLTTVAPGDGCGIDGC